jgi:hypothetical protein
LAIKTHGLGHHQTDDSATGKAVRTAGIKPPDLFRRKENRDGMHVFGVGLAQLSDFG